MLTKPRLRLLALRAEALWLRSRIFATCMAALNCSGVRALSNMAIR
jgi:hypothetical protein